MLSKRFLITVATFIAIILAALGAILLAKGYTFSSEEKRIVGTGIITINSTPDAASVFIDGHLTTATDATISSLPPKEYMVRIVKEGFIAWEKKVTVREGLVTELEVTLFPAIPTIYPLTFTGVKNPLLSPDGAKLAYIVPKTVDQTINKKAGIWVWSLQSNQPIAFARAAEPHQIASTNLIDYSNARLRWSPDSKQIIATIGSNNYLLEENTFNSDPRDITPTLQATLNTWDEEIETRDKIRLVTIKDPIRRKIASESGIIKWSPDETKFLFRKESLSEQEKNSKISIKNLKVYDLEDDQEFEIPEARVHYWLPDSRHIILGGDNEIAVIDFDGTNKAVIYAGKYEDNFIFAWPDSSRLVIISSFPTPTASEPNLYGVNLK